MSERCRPRCRSSRFAPRRQRQPAEVLVAVAQQVERDEAPSAARVERVDVARAGEVDASLQPLESRRPALVVERDDLAVDEQRRPKRRAPAARAPGRRRGTATSSRCRGATRCGCRAAACRARRAPARGCRRTSARRRRPLPVSGGSASVASIGRTFAGSSRQEACSMIASSTPKFNSQLPRQSQLELRGRKQLPVGRRQISSGVASGCLGVGSWSLGVVEACNSAQMCGICRIRPIILVAEDFEWPPGRPGKAS